MRVGVDVFENVCVGDEVEERVEVAVGLFVREGVVVAVRVKVRVGVQVLERVGVGVLVGTVQFPSVTEVETQLTRSRFGPPSEVKEVRRIVLYPSARVTTAAEVFQVAADFFD